MVKSYLRYAAERPFGVLAAPNANALLHANGVWAITPAQEYIHIYHLQQGILLHSLTHLHSTFASAASPPPSVRVLSCPANEPNVLAAGYDDGSIRLFSLVSLSCTLTLHGHSSAVTCLSFDGSGSLLVSGGADTAIVCWDVVQQKGTVRLKGHRDAVTCIALLDRGAGGVVSGSKDGSIRVWDVAGQCCVQSVASDKEVWGLALSPDLSVLVSAGVDSNVQVWTVAAQPARAAETGAEAEAEADRLTGATGKRRRSGEAGGEARESDELLHLLGTLPRASTKRCVSVSLSADGRVLAVQSADRMLEVWTVRSAQQIDKRRRSRRKRQQREGSSREEEKEAGDSEARGAPDGISADLRADDLFSALPPLLTEVKVASHCLSVAGHKRAGASASASHRLLLSLADNSLATYNLNLAAPLASAAFKSAQQHTPLSASDLYSPLSSIELPGHRSPVRALALSSDQSLLLSCSTAQLKLHSLHSQQCVRTLPCSSAALCCLFVPGNKHVVVGCKDGSIAWYELGSARRLGCVAAHDGSSVYSVHLRPDGRGFTSGGGDKCVRQWEFELVLDDSSDAGGRVLSLLLTRTLTLTDDVLCVRHSPNGKYLAVGLLDSTIKLFHSDTLLFALSLYGHRLPVLSVDFSSDSQLLASGSADKNVKVWGVAFGDCHCSLFAHADTVTQVRFVPRTHYLASAGKDGMVKLWDADARLCIQELPGHTTEVWALETAATAAQSTAGSEEAGTGELLVSAGNDRSLRVWRQSDELLFVEEEKENRREALLDKADARQGRLGEAEGVGQRAEVEGETVSGAMTADTAKGAEGLLEAIDTAYTEKQRIAAFEQQRQQQQQRESGGEVAEGSTSLDRALQQLSSRSGAVRSANSTTASPHAAELPPNPFMRGLSPAAYMLSALSALPASAVEDCLLQLPFSYALRLMDGLSEALLAGEAAVELCVSSLLTLLSVHERVIVSQRLLLGDMQRMRRVVRQRLRHVKDAYGRNRAALQLLQARVDEQRGATRFA